MFLNKSRYASVETTTASDAAGRAVEAVKLRALGQPSCTQAIVSSSDQLDVVAKRLYADGSKHWYIGDANTELETGELLRVAGRIIDIPTS